MKEISKKDLMKQLIESYMEVDEMSDFKKQQGTEKSWEPIMSEPQDSKDYEGSYKARGSELRSGKAKGSHIGHKILDKTTKQPIVIFYPCTSQIDEFISTHQSAINALKEEYGEFYISKNKTNPICEPRVTTGDLEVYKPEGERQSVDARVRFDSEISDSEYIKRQLLYPLINKVLLGDGTVQNHLERCSLPKIKVSDRANLDRHSKFSNDELTYQTLNFNSYKDVRDFFNAAVRNVQDVEVTQEEKDYREYHLARQFNLIYNKWEKTKKNNSIWRGFTDIYNLEASGYASQPFDVTVSSLLTIKGVNFLTGGYKWSVEFTTEHGKQLKDNQQLGRIKLGKDYELTSEETVNTQISTSNKDSLVKNRDVYDGLVQCLEDIKQKILQIPVQDQLKRAKLVRFELTPEEKMDLKRQRQERLSGMNQNQGEQQPELNENQINTIVKNVLREIKK